MSNNNSHAMKKEHEAEELVFESKNGPITKTKLHEVS
jgi:hypothetical protein